MTDIFPKKVFLLINYKRLRIHTIVAFSFVRTFARGFRPCFRQDGKSRREEFVQASLRLFPWRRLNRRHHCVHRHWEEDRSTFSACCRGGVRRSHPHPHTLPLSGTHTGLTFSPGYVQWGLCFAIPWFAGDLCSQPTMTRLGNHVSHRVSSIRRRWHACSPCYDKSGMQQGRN